MKTLRTLDLNLLKAFDVLMEEGSVSRAAERLAISQPAMSGTLTRLRESFGDPLFIRVQRGMVPSNRALALAPKVKKLLSEAEHLLDPEAFIPHTAALTVKIACTDYAMRAVVLPLVRVLRQQAPNVKLAVLTLDEQALPMQLERGQVDMALVTPEFNAPDIHAKHLYDERYVCAVGRHHALAGQEALSLADFCSQKQALVSYRGGGFSGVTDTALAKQGLERDVVLSVQNFLILPELLQHSDLLAVVPERLVADLADVKIFEPPLDITGFHKTLVWHERTHHDMGLKWVRERCGEAAGAFEAV